MPPGSGPRHGVALPDGRWAISGELGETLLTGPLGRGVEAWAAVRSTRLNGPARSRWERNYPGDIRLTGEGRRVCLANRSHNTLATFGRDGGRPHLLDEIDTTVDWPQHILVQPDRLLVAGWDSGRVVALATDDGVPLGVELLFECDGAGWLHSHRRG